MSEWSEYEYKADVENYIARFYSLLPAPTSFISGSNDIWVCPAAKNVDCD